MELKIKQDMNIGKKIREIRLAKQFTQEQTVAKMQLMGADTTRSAYAKIEAGLQNISVRELYLIKTLFAVGYDDILP